MCWPTLVLILASSLTFDDPEALLERSLRTIEARDPVWDRRVARRTLAALDDEALPTIVERLLDADRRVRRDLIHAVGEMESAAADTVLIAATADESWGVREQAVRALGLRAKSAALPALLDALRDPVWRVRAAGVVALRRLAQSTPGADGPTPRQAIAARLFDRDREVRRAAGWAVFRLGHAPALLTAHRILWYGPDRARPRVIRELPMTDRPEIIAILERIMADPDEELAFAAAERYAAIRGLEVFEKADMRERLRNALFRSAGRASLVMRRLRADALPFLIECLEMRSRGPRRSLPGVEKPRVRHILDLMASLGTDAAVPIFRKIIEETDDNGLLEHAIDVGRLAFPRALVDAFEKRYRDRSVVVYDIQRDLLASLARSDPERAAPLLAEAAATSTMDLHTAVLGAIDTLGPRCDRRNLLLAVVRTSRNPRILERALPMTSRLLGEEADPLILERLEWTDYAIRAAAVSALTTRKSTDNAARLRALFRASAPVVDGTPGTPEDLPSTLQGKERLRREILRSLPLVAPEPDLPFLTEALDAPEFLVRADAAKALARDAIEEAAPILVAALDRETDEIVRSEILSSLVACPGEVSEARIRAILHEGTRVDRSQILKSLATGDRPLPDAVREGLEREDWDAHLRTLAATALVEKGTGPDLDRLVNLLAQGAPPDLEVTVLQALGDRKATSQAPGLAALLPVEPLEEIDPARHDFIHSLLECVGRIENPVAAGPLRDILRRARLRDADDLDRIGEFRLQTLRLAAQSLAKIDPEGAAPDLLHIILDPVTARFHGDRGINWTSDRHRLHQTFVGVCRGIQRVPDATLTRLLGDALATRLRSGRLFGLPPGYLAAVADLLADMKAKRPRKAAAACLRRTLIHHPPTATRHAYEAARRLATRAIFLGRPEEIVEAAERARRILILDPDLGRTAGERRREADLMAALALAGRGAAAGDAGDTAERLRLFRQAADIDTGHTEIAYYLAWGGLYRGIDIEQVQVWTQRATALSASGDTQRWTVLDLQGVVFRRSGDLARAEHFLERAERGSRGARSGMAAYHLAVVLCELEQHERGREVLYRALEKDDTWWPYARRETSFAPLREDDGIERLIAEARETFD